MNKIMLGSRGAPVPKELVDAAISGDSVTTTRGFPVRLSAEIQVEIDGFDCVTVFTGKGNAGDSSWENRDAKRFAEEWECLHRDEIAERLRSAEMLDFLPSDIEKYEWTPLAQIEIAEGSWGGLPYTVCGVLAAQRID